MLIVTKSSSLFERIEDICSSMGLDVARTDETSLDLELGGAPPPELVLVDTEMGFEATKRCCSTVRSVAKPDVTALLILVKDEMTDDDATALLVAGADGLLGQRLQPLSFMARISAHLGRLAYARDLALRVHDSELLIDVTSRLVGSADIVGDLYEVASLIARELHVDRCSMVLVRPEGDFGLVVASSDNPELKDLAINLHRYPEITEVVERGTAIFIDDVSHADMLENVLPDILNAGIFSIALFPIGKPGKVLGVVFLRFRDHRTAFQRREQIFCQTVTNAVSIALKNAEILELLRAKTREYEQVQEEVASKLRNLKQYEDLLVGAVDGMVAMERDARIVFANKAASLMLGADATILPGQLFTERLRVGEQEQFRALLEEFFAGKAERSLDFSFQIDGKKGVVAISAGSLLGEESLVLITMRDVTEERIVEERLKEARLQLVKSEKQVAMAEMAGAAAHELNQPLTSIMTSLAMLRRLIGGGEKETLIIDTMENESERMAEIIRRMSNITQYTTKSYVGEAKIIDLDSAYSDTDKDDS